MNTILFTQAAYGFYNFALYVANADGSNEQPLLESTGLNYNPTWSADGQWIAFTSERNSSADLYRVRPAGTGLERLTDSPAFDDQAAWSPDGRQIVFVSTRAAGTADLWILDINARKARPLTSGPSGDFRPSWSPDGKWIAFSSDRGYPLAKEKGGTGFIQLQFADIYLVHPDGSGLRRISEHGNFCGSPKWSHDSRRVVAYCGSAEDMASPRNPARGGETRLVSIDIGGGTITNVSSGSGLKISPTMFASGEIAYVRRDERSLGIVYDSGKHGPTGQLRSPSWSPDGGRIVYHRPIVNLSNAAQKIWSRNADYALMRTRVQTPSFHPSGQRFVGYAGGELTLVRMDTGESHLLLSDGKETYPGQWSPTGDAIIFGLGGFFSFGRDKGAQVALIKEDGSGLRLLTSGANNNGFPSLSPDGERFVYRTIGAEGQGLRIMNLEDNSVTSLTTEYDNFPVWSPRGDLIVFTRLYHDDYEIFSIHPDGNGLRRLTSSPGHDSHASWSPDGQWLAFTSARMGFKDEALNTDSGQPYGEIFVMRYDGSHIQQLTDNQREDGTPVWQPHTGLRGIDSNAPSGKKH